MNTAALLAERPVTALRGVGPALAELLAKLGLHTVQDVLFHLPLRYEDRTRVVPIGALRNGDRAVIEGEIQLAEVAFRRRRMLLVRIADGTGYVTLRFFHFSAAQQAQLVRGQRLRCFGEARLGPGGVRAPMVMTLAVFLVIVVPAVVLVAQRSALLGGSRLRHAAVMLLTRFMISWTS